MHKCTLNAEQQKWASYTLSTLYSHELANESKLCLLSVIKMHSVVFRTAESPWSGRRTWWLRGLLWPEESRLWSVKIPIQTGTVDSFHFSTVLSLVEQIGTFSGEGFSIKWTENTLDSDMNYPLKLSCQLLTPPKPKIRFFVLSSIPSASQNLFDP